MVNIYQSEEKLINAKELRLVTGEEGLHLLSDIKFQIKWDELYESCTWGTVLQSRNFVTQWYQIYQNEYLPIIVTSDRGEALDGLLTMALPLHEVRSSDLKSCKGNIIGAGQYDAEYQVWLADEANKDLFIKQALKIVNAQFPHCHVHFRFLPSDAPLKWLQEYSYQRKTILQSFRRPLMDTQDPVFPGLFKKPEFRNKLNRLKKLGDLKFIHIRDTASFTKVLQEAAVQFDFRQGAMFNKNQFRDNPLKSDFLKALFEQNLLHVTVLEINDEVVATIMAVEGSCWVHLGGINVHTPFRANYFSPGFVHFLMLGQYLAQEGIKIFDLTPGGDSYKDRLATTYDTVFELIIPGSSAYNFKKRLRTQFQNQLIKVGIRPMSFDLALRKMVYLLKNKTKSLKQFRRSITLLWNLKSIFPFPRVSCIKLNNWASSKDSSIVVEKNNLHHMLDYEQNGTWQTRWEFLAEAMRRYEVGEQSYSWSEDGELRCCVWQVARAAAPQSVVTQLPEDAILLQGLYCHPAAKDALNDFLAALAGKLAPAAKDIILLETPGKFLLRNTA